MVLFFIHVLITAAYYGVTRPKYAKGICRVETCIVALLPFFGVFVLLGTKFLSRMYPYQTPESHKLQRDGIVFSDVVKYDEDIIPLYDTLFVDDELKKRHFFTDAIKQNVLDNQSILQQAVHDEDREIAYYAISMLTTNLENIEANLSKMQKKLDQGTEEEELALLKEYAENLRAYIKQSFIDPLSRRSKEESYSAVCGRLIELDPNEDRYYVEKINQDIALHKYQTAEEVCERFLQQYPMTEIPFLLYIRLYQAMHDRERIQRKIDELKACPIKLTGEALRVIRFWDREAVTRV